jgi:hypothetical protein
MADSKISALPASTTPLAGTEVLPIVQSSTTRQVSVANLTAGRAISATQLTLTTGNLIVASGQGIDFSATSGAPGATSELFNDYEIGTFTATLTSATPPTTPITATAYYTKTGDQVTVYCPFRNVDNTGAAGAISVTGLPFTSNASNYAVGSVWCGRATILTGLVLNLSSSSTAITLLDFSGNTVSWASTGAGVYAGFEITYKV